MKKKTIFIHFALFLYLIVGCNITQFLDDEPSGMESSTTLNHVNGFHSNELLCGTNNNVPNQAFEKAVGTFNLMALQNNSYCIRVAFYIVRNDNGSGGFNSDDIPQIMRNLNQVYNPRNVYIFNEGVKYINSSKYYDLSVGNGNNEFPSLIASNNSTSAINFYLVNSVHDGGTGYAGMAENIPSRNLVVANSMALTPTSAHEVGHCLNLFHTHRGTSEGGCNENINGSNCSSCGDYVCDTPADPRLGPHNLSSCMYIGGGGYNPLVGNLMSYSGYCRDSFTNGQGTRMLSALASSLALQPIINSNCNIPTLNGINSLCTSPSIYTLNNLPVNTTVTWSSSSGMLTLSNQSANSVTVESNTSMATTAELVAHINYADGNRINIAKTITVMGTSVPHISIDQPSMSCFSMNSTRYFNAGFSSDTGYESIENHPNISEIDWLIFEYSSSTPTQITNFQKYSNSVINSSISFSMPYKSNEYVITIVPRAKSKCGSSWGPWGPGYSYRVKNNCSFAVYAFDTTYNLSNQRYTLSFSESYRNIRKTISTNIIMQSKISDNYDIRIYDDNHKEVYSRIQSNENNIEVPRLPSGNYIVELLQDGYIYTQNLNIK